jgi:condensin complex subunit 1
MQLLFTVLASPSTDAVTRANVIVAMGDIAFRFPNIFEPWSPLLLKCLRDKNARVRKHCLLVLTHLILNDMVKPKGPIAEIRLQDRIVHGAFGMRRGEGEEPLS